MMLLFQVVGIAALLLDIASLQRKHRRHILIMQIMASITWVIHFGLIGAIAGAAMNSVGILRSVSYSRLPATGPRPQGVLWSIIALSIVVTAIVWQGMASLLPMMAMIIAAIAFWQRSEQMIRLLLLLCVPLWFTYNLLFLSYAGMASDTLALISAIVALYRYRKQGLGSAAGSPQPLKAAITT